MRITKRELEKRVTLLNKKLGRPATALNEAREWNEGHIKLDYAPVYGGYALREVTKNGGEAFYWPFWTRVSAREMMAFLEGQLMILEERE